jgi:hypothetical protein
VRFKDAKQDVLFIRIGDIHAERALLMSLGQSTFSTNVPRALLENYRLKAITLKVTGSGSFRGSGGADIRPSPRMRISQTYSVSHKA